MVLSFFQKITHLATKIQDLKREHTALSDEVKLTVNFFPDAAVVDTIQLLNIQIHKLHQNCPDGTHPCPSPFITTTAHAPSPNASADSDSSTVVPPVTTSVPNPDYLVWYHTDQTLVNMLRATLTEHVLSLTVGLSNSCEIWEHLRQNFSQQSLANSTHTRFQLLSL